jgi:hypothetical protein
MNRFPVLIFILAAFSSVPLAAQQPGTRSQQPTTQRTTTADPGSLAEISFSAASPSPNPQQGSAPAVAVPSTANSPEISNPQLRPVSGDLEDKLDTKSAKTGDSVVIKTTEKASTAQGVTIPKGSKILGHVTDVEAKGKSGDNSRVTVQFDQAELKGGQTMPIKSVLQSLEPAGGSASGAAGGYRGGSAAGAGMPAASSAGSGVTGRSGAESANTTTNPATSPAASAATSPTASSPAPGAPAVGTIVARNGNVAIRTTAIPGVLLAANADGQPFTNASGALLGAKRDVHLDTGTHVVVAIAESNSKNIR